MLNYDFVVSDDAFRYLRVHRGSLDHLKHDRRRWDRAYARQIRQSYESMLPHLPDRCASVLDVGSGLGGIDVLLRRHYAPEPVVTLLDGEDDEPVVELHRRTFCSREAALAFQEANGGRAQYRSPHNLLPLLVPADLVVSTGAWCFHFEPSTYLEYVLENSAPGVTMILDVRNDKPSWLAYLLNHLDCVDVAAVERKRTRRVFKRR